MFLDVFGYVFVFLDSIVWGLAEHLTCLILLGSTGS